MRQNHRPMTVRLIKKVFSAIISPASFETEQGEEAKVLLSDALDSGLPDRYEKHARELLAKND